MGRRAVILAGGKGSRLGPYTTVLPKPLLPEVRTWLARPENQRITLHFVPTSCSWLNLVECFFSIITRQAIRRGTFTSVKELTATIGAFIDHWNEHPRPFTWTKDADEILAKINRAKAKTSVLTRH